MNKRNSIIFLSIISAIFVIMPVIVILRTCHLKAGYKGLTWGRTEAQVQMWIKKNNNKAIWNRCNLSHYGVTCWKLTWKNLESSPYEFIEFQFKDGMLVSVIETEREKPYSRQIDTMFGRPDYGTDIAASSVQKDKGIKFQYINRIFYYTGRRHLSGTKTRIAVERLIKYTLNDSTVPEETILYRVTTGYYSPEYYDSIKNSHESFPSKKFLKP